MNQSPKKKKNCGNSVFGTSCSTSTDKPNTHQSSRSKEEELLIDLAPHTAKHLHLTAINHPRKRQLVGFLSSLKLECSTVRLSTP